MLLRSHHLTLRVPPVHLSKVYNVTNLLSIARTVRPAAHLFSLPPPPSPSPVPLTSPLVTIWFDPHSLLPVFLLPHPARRCKTPRTYRHRTDGSTGRTFIPIHTPSLIPVYHIMNLPLSHGRFDRPYVHFPSLLPVYHLPISARRCTTSRTDRHRTNRGAFISLHTPSALPVYRLPSLP